MYSFKSIFMLSAQLSALVFLACNAPINPANSSKAEKIDNLLQDYADYGKFNGTVLIAKGGKIIYKNGFGNANMEWDIPNKTDTKFRIASLTKQFTAVLILQLAADGKLDLHTPIAAYLPDYPKENAQKITAHHLLTHTSGIPELDLYLDQDKIERNRFRPRELMALYAHQPLEFKTGSRFQYSNPGYYTLGLLIEALSGTSFENVLQEKILDPLNMSNTRVENSYTLVKNRASGYYRKYLRGDYVNANYLDMSVPYAAGAMFSTVEDLHLWNQALYSEKILPKMYLDLMFTPHIKAGSRNYGYGWFVGTLPQGSSNKSSNTVEHGGGMDGFNSFLVRIPEDSTFMVLLNNTGRAPLHQISEAVNGILNNQIYHLHKSVGYELSKKIRTDGTREIQSFYDSIFSNNNFYLNEDEMNIAAYEPHFEGKNQEAEAIFKLNVAAFPNS